MSKSTRGSYPHPVLDASDDVKAEIEVYNASFAPSVDDIEIKFQVRMTDPDLKIMLDNGSAKYSFRWSCSSTIATGDLAAEVHQFHSDSTSFIGWIDQEQVRDTVRIEIKIVAADAIDMYQLQNQHDDYGDATFQLRPGDILAEGGILEFEAKKLYDPLMPPLGSCFQFVSDSTVKRGLRVRFHDDDHVIGAFPDSLLRGFGLLRNRQDLQISLVVLPALMETVAYIRKNEAADNEDEDLSTKKWYRAVIRLMEQAKSSGQGPLELAQEILGNPLDISLTAPFGEED